MRRDWRAGDSGLPWGAGGFPSSGTLARVELVEHFTQIGDSMAGVLVSSSGASAGPSAVAAPAGRVGVVSLSTGTDTTGRSSVTSGNAAVPFGSGRLRLRWDVNVPTASDGTDTFTARVGFADTLSGDSADGAYFRYTHGTNGGRWECVTRAAGSETATDSGVELSAGTFRVFEIEVNPDATLAAFYVDGSPVQTHTDDIPTGSGRETGFAAGLVKSAGATARTIEVDLMAFSFDPISLL